MQWPLRRRSKEEELEEEILAHLAIEAKQRVEDGETPEEAERAARRVHELGASPIDFPGAKGERAGLKVLVYGLA